MEELAVLRKRQAQVANDIDALDRTLETLGYAGDVQLTARVPRVVLFYRGELRQYLVGQLKTGQKTSLQMAEALATEEGKDIYDRRMPTDIVKRMGKALRLMADAGIVTRTPDKISGEYVWAFLEAKTYQLQPLPACCQACIIFLSQKIHPPPTDTYFFSTTCRKRSNLSFSLSRDNL